MTFSIVARCSTTRALGIGIASASVAVGARCPWARSGTAAVVTQSRTDPRLGPLILDGVASGLSGAAALALVLREAPFAEWRQLAVVDHAGNVATHSGRHCSGLHGEARSGGMVALGNLLAAATVPSAMRASFEETAGALETRLLAALAGGLRAGGETRAIRSAALVVVADDLFPRTHLRVDCAAAPLDDLAALWNAWQPEMATCRQWALDPSGA